MTEKPLSLAASAGPKRRFWSDARLSRFALALFIGILIAVGYTLISDREGRSFIKSGDFPGFYAPALIAVSRNIDYLYDAHIQRGIENLYWPSFNGEFYMSVYPPYTAILLSPLAYLQPQTARHVFTLVSLGSFLLSLLIIGRLNRFIRENFFVAAVLMLSIAPVFYGVLGGQNTALSMLLLSSSAYCVKQAGTRYAVPWKLASGIFLGLLLYKPQFGAPALLLVLLGGQYLVFMGALLPAAAFCGLSYLTFGPRWLAVWTSALQAFSPLNYVMNLHEQVSLMGFVAGLNAGRHDTLGLGGVGAAFAIVGSIIAVLYVASKLQRAGELPPEPRAVALFDSWLLIAAVLPLISPQTLFYDLGIAVLASARFFKPKSDGAFTLFLLWLALVWALIYFRAAFAVSPLLIISFMLFFYVAKRAAIPGLRR